jgi:hypothetical protein
VISPRVGRTTGFSFLLFGSILATAAGAEPVCLSVQKTGAIARYPVSIGDKFNITFRHSIYGSQVEEHFRVTAQGFQLFELRYAESRLVEFYGHEWAANEDGRWVVRKLGPVLASLDLHVSSGSWIGVISGAEKVTVTHDPPSDGRARLALSACPRSNHG